MTLSLSEFRNKYPQYNDISDDELANSFYDKYYKNIPRDQFNREIGIRPNTSRPESTWGETLSSIGPSAKAGIERGIGGVLSGLGSAFPQTFGEVGEVGEMFGRGAGEQLRQLEPNVPEGSAKYYTQKIGTAAAETAPAIGLGIIGGAPLVAGAFGATAGGNKYLEQIEAGRTPEQAALPALGSAAINTAAGFIPMKFLESSISPLAKVALGTAGGAGIGGGLAGVEAGINKASINPDMTMDDFIKAMKEGAIVGGALGGGFPAAHELAFKGRSGKPVQNETEISTQERIEPRVSEEVTRPETTAELLPQQENSGITLQDVIEKGIDPYQSLEQLPNPVTQEQIAALKQERDNTLSDILTERNIPEEDRTATPEHGVDKLVELNKQIDKIKQQLPVDEIHLSPETDIDTVTPTLKSISEGNYENINPKILGDLIDSGHLEINSKGDISLTEQGRKLDTIINEIQAKRDFVKPEEIDNIVDTHNNRVMKEEESWEKEAPKDYMERATPEEERLIEQYLETKRQEPAPAGSEQSTSPTVRDIINLRDGIAKNEINDRQFSVTPTEKFNQEYQNIRDNVEKIARKINPSVKVNFADELLGYGQALKESGASTTEQQPVAGSYSKARNLMEVSLDVSKFDPTNTAHHELWHSLETMLPEKDISILNDAFPGNDKVSALEQRAIAFADYMGKRGKGFSAGVRKAFDTVANALRQIGRTLKLGKFNTIDDVFYRASTGDIFNKYVARKTSEAIGNADTATLGEMFRNGLLDFNGLREAVKKTNPELFNAVYEGKPLTAIEQQNMLDAVADQSPENALNALVHRVGNNKVPFDEQAIDNATLRYLENFLPKEEAKDYLDAKKHAIRQDIYNMKQGGIKDALSHLGSILFNGNDTNIRNYATHAIDPFTGKRTISKTAIEVANMFYNLQGTGESRNPTYYYRIRDFVDPISERLVKVSKDLNTSDLIQLTKILQNPQKTLNTKNEKVTKAAIEFAKINQDILDFAAKNGLDIREVEGYFPRQYQTDLILSRPKEFLKDAVEAYRQTAKDQPARDAARAIRDSQYAWQEVMDAKGSPQAKELYDNAIRLEKIAEKAKEYADNFIYEETPEMAEQYKQSAERWLDAIQNNEEGISPTENGFDIEPKIVPMPNSLKGRVLSKEADNIMSSWLNQNPIEVMLQHINSVGRKSVFNDMFSDGKWKAMEQQMASEGLPAKYIEQIKDIVKINTGIKWGRPSNLQANMFGLARMYSSMRFLPLAAKNAIQEIATVAIQKGSLRNLHKDYIDAGKIFAKYAYEDKLKGWSPELEHAMAMSDAMGLTSEIAQQMLVDARAESGFAKDKYSRALHKFFDTTGISPLTRANRVVAFMSGDRLLRNLSEDITTNNNRYKSAEFMMKDLGVPEDKVAEFSQWLKELPFKDMTENMVTSQDEMPTIYRMAQRRFIDNAVQNPTAAVKARYATHPFGSIIYSLTSFFMEMEKNILGKNYRLLKTAVTNKNAEGAKLDLTSQDRLRLAMPGLLVLGVAPTVALAFNQIWDKLYHNKNAKPEKQTTFQKATNMLAQTPFAGRFTPIISNLAFKGDVQKLGQGALPGTIYQSINDAFQVATDQGNGNGKKRALAKDIISNAVLPTANYAITLSPMPAPLKFATMQMLNHPATKNKAQDILAGEARNQ